MMESIFPARQSQFLALVSLIGVSYFVFLVGLKMDILMTMRAAKSTWRLGVIPFLASFAVLTILFDHCYNPQNLSHFRLQISRVFLSASMSATNFPVMVEALSELNLIATELGQIALSSSMMNDNIHWSFILINQIMSANNMKISIMYFSGGVLFLSFSIFVVRPSMKLIVRKTPVGKPVKEIYVVFILLGVLVMAAISDMVFVSFIMGPLIYGLVIPSGPPLATTLVEKSEVVMKEFFLPFFFISIGVKTNLSALQNWHRFLMLQGIFLAGDLTKVVVCVLVSITYNIRARHGMTLGLMLNFKGITQLIAIVRMTQLKVSSFFCFYISSANICLFSGNQSRNFMLLEKIYIILKI